MILVFIFNDCHSYVISHICSLTWSGYSQNFWKVVDKTLHQNILANDKYLRYNDASLRHYCTYFLELGLMYLSVTHYLQ
jgi:hypothetical protein